ncbi:MAG: DUF2877 domain-containing protein [Nitrososphaera sp.]
MIREQSTFDCTCIGDLHARLMLDRIGAIGKVLNAFETTINIRTETDELLVITQGKLRSPANVNVSPSDGNPEFNRIIGEGAQARLQVALNRQPSTSLIIGDVTVFLSWQSIFRNQFSTPEPEDIETFANNSDRIFASLVMEAQANRFGCLLKPDITTRGLFKSFLEQLVRNKVVTNHHEFTDKLSNGLLELCGKGPGFTPAGDDFIAGYLAMFNWLFGTMNLANSIIPGNEFLRLTTWTSFKLMEYSARNMLDDQAQVMINCLAHDNVDAYVRAIELISKRGHTSGLDFATGMTLALFTIADRQYNTSVLESILRQITS